MGKVDDILSEIKLFISGDDWSETLQIRKAVAFYVQACRETNAQLAECRKLLDKDLILDAKRLNAEMTPTLTERAIKLSLHGEKFERLTQLCSMYGYEMPALIDMDTVKKLRESSTDTTMNSLILRWRKIARSHDNISKITLLREILAASPADEQMWKSNLFSVEQKYIKEIEEAANKAVSENDGRKVIEYYNILNSDEWLTPPSEDIIARYRSFADATRQEMFAKALESKRNDLFAAYSIMDSAMMKKILSEYDMMTKNKLYQKDPVAERAVDDVRKYLIENDQNNSKQKEFTQKKNALIQLLDQHGNYENIENLYEALRRMDLPLDESLSMRVANHREEYLSEISRRHTRKCIYCIVGAVVLIGLLGVGFTLLQGYRTYRSYQSQMNELQKSGNYEGVLQLYEEVAAKSSMALRFGNLSAMKLEAQRLLAEQKERNKTLDTILTQGENILKNDEPDLKELQIIMGKIAPMKSDKMGSELRSRYENFETNVKILEEKAQNELLNQFFNEIAAVKEKLKRCANVDNISDIDQSQQDIELLFTEAQNIIDKYRNSLKKDVIDSTQDDINFIKEECNRNLKKLSLLRYLLKPTSAISYLNTLEELPEKSPQLAAGAWKYAVKNAKFWKDLRTSFQLVDLKKEYSAIKNDFNKNNIQTVNNPVAEDLTVLFSENINGDKFADKLDELEKELLPLYKRYELIFTAKDGSVWCYYSKNAPNVEFAKNTSRPYAISMEFEYNNENNYQTFEIATDGTFKCADNDPIVPGLPTTYQKLNNTRLVSRDIPLAMHYYELKNIISHLRSVKSAMEAEELVLKHLKRLIADTDMNAVARMELIYHLLDLLQKCSSFGAPMCVNLKENMEMSARHLFSQKNNPDVLYKDPRTMNDFNKLSAALKNLNLPEKIAYLRNIYVISLQRSLFPGGIIIKKGNKNYVHFFNIPRKNSEIWVYLNNDRKGWLMWTAESLTNDKCLPQSVDLPHGTLFFSPTDEKSTAELTEKIKNDLKKLNIDLPKWPVNWPLNSR